MLEPSKISARNNFGKEGKGPGAYLPPRFPLENGEVVEIRDQSEHLKFKAVWHIQYRKMVILSEKPARTKRQHQAVL